MSVSEKALEDLEIVGDTNQTLPVRIAAGARLWNLVERAKKALGPLKEELRLEGRNQLGGATSGVVTVEGDGMTRAIVTFPEPTLTVHKDADLLGVKGRLTPEIFGSIFEESTIYKLRPNAKTLITELEPWVAGPIFDAVYEVEGTPRVSLRWVGEGISEMSETPESERERVLQSLLMKLEPSALTAFVNRLCDESGVDTSEWSPGFIEGFVAQYLKS